MTPWGFEWGAVSRIQGTEELGLRLQKSEGQAS